MFMSVGKKRKKTKRMGGHGYDLGGFLPDLFCRGVRIQFPLVPARRDPLAFAVSSSWRHACAASARARRPCGRREWADTWDNCVAAEFDDPGSFSGVVWRHRVL